MLFNLNHSIPVGVRYMLFSAMGFALMSACVKLVSAYDIPVLEIVAARALVSLILSYLDIKRKGIPVWGNNKRLLIARGAVGALALICIYYSVTTLPLAEATILQYLYPAFTAVLAILFLNERVHFSTIICILLCIAGLVLIVRPGQSLMAIEYLPTLSLIAAIIGAFGSSVAYVIIRKLGQQEDSSVIIFYFPFIALPLSVVLLGRDFVMPSGEALLLLLLVGVFTQVGQVGLTKAMQTETASKATAYSYVQIIFAVTLGWLLFEEVPSLWTWAGGALIVTGALINLFGARLFAAITKVHR